MEATPTDIALLRRLRSELGEHIDSSIEGLIANPSENQAGYVRGLRAAILKAESIAEDLTTLKTEKK